MPIYGKTACFGPLQALLLNNLSTDSTPCQVDKIVVNFFVIPGDFCLLGRDCRIWERYLTFLRIDFVILDLI
jgi:hypothetical protein